MQKKRIWIQRPALQDRYKPDQHFFLHKFSFLVKIYNLIHIHIADIVV